MCVHDRESAARRRVPRSLSTLASVSDPYPSDKYPKKLPKNRRYFLYTAMIHDATLKLRNSEKHLVAAEIAQGAVCGGLAQSRRRSIQEDDLELQ